MVVDYAEELFNVIKNGLGNFVDFILYLPTLFYDLIEVIPKPFYGILYYFISLFIFIVVTYAIARLISTITGG